MVPCGRYLERGAPVARNPYKTSRMASRAYARRAIERGRRDGGSGNSARILMLLVGYVGERADAWPSRETLAGEIGTHVRAVDKALADLRDMGFIRREHYRNHGRVKITEIDMGLIETLGAEPVYRTNEQRSNVQPRLHERTGLTCTNEQVTPARTNRSNLHERAGLLERPEKVKEETPGEMIGVPSPQCDTMPTGGYVFSLSALREHFEGMAFESEREFRDWVQCYAPSDVQDDVMTWWAARFKGRKSPGG